MQIEDFSIRLRHGAGNGDPRNGLCLMQAVSWFDGANVVSDHPKCVSPALCGLGIKINDMAPSQKHRDLLKPLIWLLLDSRDTVAELKRVEHILREVARRIVAPMFDKKYPAIASQLRQAHSMREIQSAAREASEEAARWAAGAASAASALVEATAWAASPIAPRAAAEWAAAAASPLGERAAWEELRAIFVEAIQLGRHGSIDPVYVPRAMELARVLATVE